MNNQDWKSHTITTPRPTIADRLTAFSRDNPGWQRFTVPARQIRQEAHHHGFAAQARGYGEMFVEALDCEDEEALRSLRAFIDYVRTGKVPAVDSEPSEEACEIAREFDSVHHLQNVYVVELEGFAPLRITLPGKETATDREGTLLRWLRYLDRG